MNTNRTDRFLYKADDVEVHRVTARAVAYDAARTRLGEVEVVDADPADAAHRAIDELYKWVHDWRTVELTVTRQ
jgi:hypothetical protein